MKKRILTMLLALALLAALVTPALAESSYTDVDQDDWFSDSVEFCLNSGLMDGVGEGLFDPDTSVTRAMAVTVLWRLMGQPGVERESAFTDLTAEWYRPAVQWAALIGLAEGYEDGRFGPDDILTREQVAAFFWRMAGRPQTESAEIADAAVVSDYAQLPVRWTVSGGLLELDENGNFEPQAALSRAWLAELLYRFSLYTATQPLVVNELEELCAPVAVARSDDGALFVTDSYYKVVWRVQGGEASIYAGEDSVRDRYGRPLGGYSDGKRTEALFASPWAITPFMKGWAVSDPENGAVRYLTENGVSTVNASGLRLKYPTGLASDEDGNLYIADTDAGEVYRVTPAGMSRTFVSGLNDPMGLAWGGGILYIAEAGGNRILAYSGGNLFVVAGSGAEGCEDGEAARATFTAPQALTVDDNGVIYVSDTVSGAVRRIAEGKVDTLIAMDRIGGIYPVTPMGLMVWGSRLYVCENYVRKLFTVSVAGLEG